MAFLKKITLNGQEYDLSSNLVDKGGIAADSSTGGLKLDLKEDGGLTLGDDGKLAIDTTKFGVKSVASADKTVTVTNTDGAVGLAVNIDSKTIVKSSDGVLSVADSALTQYVGKDAIAVSDADDKNQKTVSLTIDPSDKVLSQGTNGLLSTLNLSYDSNNKKIYLYGKGTANVISTIDATDFIKDGMLESAELVTTAEADVDTDVPYIKLTFNTDSGKDAIRFSVKDLVDVYTAGDGLTLSDNNFAVKVDETSENYLTVGADGVKLSGIGAIQTEVDAIETAVGLTEAGAYTSPTTGVMAGAKTLVEATEKLEQAISGNKAMFYVQDNTLYIHGVLSEDAKTKA